MKHRVWILMMLSIVFLPIAVRHTTEYVQAIARNRAALEAGQIDKKTERAKGAAAYVDFVGSSAYWHMGAFLALIGAMNIGYENVQRKAAKGLFFVITGAVFLLALKSFFYADESARFLSDDLRAQYFNQIVDIRIASSLIALFAGRIFYEMSKPVFSK